jgi:hypothetical protein
LTISNSCFNSSTTLEFVDTYALSQLTKVDDYSFMGCQNVQISGFSSTSLQYIGDFAFNGC